MAKSNLPAKVQAMLTAVKEEDKALQGANPLSMIVDALADTLSLPIHDKIIKLVNEVPQEAENYEELFRLHGEVVLFLNSVGYKEFDIKEIEKYQSYNRRDLEEGNIASEKQNVTNLEKDVEYIYKAVTKIREDAYFNGDNAVEKGKELCKEYLEKKIDEQVPKEAANTSFGNNKYENVLHAKYLLGLLFIRDSNIKMGSLKSKIQILEEQFKKKGEKLNDVEEERYQKFQDNLDPLYSPSIYLAKYDKWRAKKIAESLGPILKQIFPAQQDGKK